MGLLTATFCRMAKDIRVKKYNKDEYKIVRTVIIDGKEKKIAKRIKKPVVTPDTKILPPTNLSTAVSTSTSVEGVRYYDCTFQKQTSGRRKLKFYSDEEDSFEGSDASTHVDDYVEETTSTSEYIESMISSSSSESNQQIKVISNSNMKKVSFKVETSDEPYADFKKNRQDSDKAKAARR